MIRLLHFADAHIDIANYGRHDPVSGLPLRVLDFLKALDTIIDAAIDEKVDLVIFAGDAYKDRSPAPTFQREWGRRVIRLSRAGIETILLVGNHDLSPALGRAHALQEYDTLEVPHVHVVDVPRLLKPVDLGGLAVQVLALPWVSRSKLMATLKLSGMEMSSVHEQIETRIREVFEDWFTQLDPDLPAVFTAHATIQGAMYGGERSVMLGNDLVLPGALVRDPRLDYVALGHIHKAQDLNPRAHPPVIYPGSIERVDFGEAKDQKHYVIATVDRGKTEVDWRSLDGRRFIDRLVSVNSDGQPMPEPDALLQKMLAALPDQEQLKDAIVRLVIEYPRGWEALINESALRRYAEGAFDFHLVRRPQAEIRIRLSGHETIGSATPLELLDRYWKTLHMNDEEVEVINHLAREVVSAASQVEFPPDTPANEI